MEWKTIQIGWVLMKKYWKKGYREDGRGLKQVSHKKPFKKLFLGVSRLGELRGSVAKIFASREQVAKIFASREWVVSKPRMSRQKLLDELATGVSRLASRQLSREKHWHLFFNTEHG